MSDPVVSTPLAVSAIGVTLRKVWPQRADLTVQVAFDKTMDLETIDAEMDVLAHIIEREELRAQIAEKEKAVEIEREQPIVLQKEIDRLVTDKAVQEAGHQAAYAVSGKRSPYRPTAAQEASLARYDAEIANARKAIDGARKSLPITEWQLECLRARYHGRPAPEMPANLLRRIADTMDMAAE